MLPKENQRGFNRFESNNYHNILNKNIMIALISPLSI